MGLLLDERRTLVEDERYVLLGRERVVVEQLLLGALLEIVSVPADEGLELLLTILKPFQTFFDRCAQVSESDKEQTWQRVKEHLHCSSSGVDKSLLLYVTFARRLPIPDLQPSAAAISHQ